VPFIPATIFGINPFSVNPHLFINNKEYRSIVLWNYYWKVCANLTKSETNIIYMVTRLSYPRRLVPSRLWIHPMADPSILASFFWVSCVHPFFALRRRLLEVRSLAVEALEVDANRMVYLVVVFAVFLLE
jgi:hypothetical protein